MITISRTNTNHNFEKQNLVTIMSPRGPYDLYKCSLCGLRAKGYSLTELKIEKRYSKTANNCPKAETVKRIKITNCRAVGKAFANLTPGSVHSVIDPPEGYNNSRGVWVMGVGEPVKVLFEEFVEGE